MYFKKVFVSSIFIWLFIFFSPDRVNSPRGLPAGYTGGDPILSPQPSPGNYNPPVSTYNAPMPVSTSSNFSNDNFSYDQQVYPASMVDR